MKRLMAIAAVTAVLAGVAEAEDTPSRGGERPPWLVEEFFLARNAHPQDGHEVQVTWSLEHGHEDEISTTDVGLEVEYGVTNRLQLEAELPWRRVRPSGGDESSAFGNVEAGVMYALARGPRRMLSAGFDVALPTAASDNQGDAETQVEPFAIVGHAIGHGEAHASLSYALGGSHELTWDVAGVVPLHKWRGTLELNGRREEGANSLRITPGVMWKGIPAYELGVAMPVGVHGAPRVGIVLKVDAEF